MKPIHVGTILVICALLALGCQNKGLLEPVTLKVAGIDRETFMEWYGNAYELENSDITFEVIPYHLIPNGGETKEDLVNFMTEYQPDILILGTFNFRSAVETGSLLPMDSLLDQSKLVHSQYPESLLQRIRNDSGRGQLFGLSPYYSSSALFYNKSLFDTYQVEYPTNQMSWADIFSIASKFPEHNENGDRIYGFYQPDRSSIEEKLFRMIYYAGLGENLSFLDPLSKEVTLNTPSWKHLWEAFIHAYRDGIISDEQLVKLSDFPGTIPRERVKEFVEGKAAMVVAETTVFELADELVELEIGIVEVPGTYQTRMQAGDTFAITTLSKYPDEAWDFIEFVHSEQAGLFHMKWGSLPIYSSQLEKQWGLDLTAYHKKEVSEYSIYSDMGLPAGFISRYFEAGVHEVGLILHEGKSIEEAMYDLQAILDVEF